MAGRVKKETKSTKKAYKMPEPLSSGTILKDVGKQSWILEKTIGTGGFGAIYSASKEGYRDKSYAVKVEPHENGPLFCERTVYLNIVKKDLVEEFMKKHKLKLFGLPEFYGFGSYLHNGTNYRFIVIDRFGRDLWSIFEENASTLPLNTVLKISTQVLYVLEYMHDQGYVHNDVKAANLLLGLTKKTEHQVYLVDFGLACKYAAHARPNPKKAHNGTLEYTSRDAHLGATTRRGDLEVLCYNILHWLGGSLPWLNLKKPQDVQQEKIKFMNDIKNSIQKCCRENLPPESVIKFIQKVANLSIDETPNYERLQKLLHQDQIDKSSKLVFESSKPKRARSQRRLIIPESDPEEEEEKVVENKVEKPKGKRLRAAVSENDVPREVKKVVKKMKTDKKTEGTKRSWRDFPTVVHGGVSYRADDNEK